MSPTPTPGPLQVRRLTRMQQLTLNTWGWAAVNLARELDSHDILGHAAIHVVLGSLRDVDDPLALSSVTPPRTPSTPCSRVCCRSRFSQVSATRSSTQHSLLRREELVANGGGPEELPPLRRAQTTARGVRL